MNKQLLKDFGRMLNDGRIGFVGVRKHGNGVLIGSIVFSNGYGSYFTVLRDVALDYDNLIAMIRAVYAYHPTRNLGDVLYSFVFDTERNTLSMGVTNSANLELYNVKHTRLSAELRAVLEAVIAKNAIYYRTQYCNKFINEFNKSGGFSFTLP